MKQRGAEYTSAIIYMEHVGSPARPQSFLLDTLLVPDGVKGSETDRKKERVEKVN